MSGQSSTGSGDARRDQRERQLITGSVGPRSTGFRGRARRHHGASTDPVTDSPGADPTNESDAAPLAAAE
jgi:hypothetical protein